MNLDDLLKRTREVAKSLVESRIRPLGVRLGHLLGRLAVSIRNLKLEDLKKRPELVALAAVLLLFIGVMLVRPPAAPPEEPQPDEIRRPLGEEPTISVYMHRTGKVEHMKMEDYIAGVVAAEMSPNWHVEALAAQAIIARTFTVRRIEDGGVKKRGTDASTDILEFQAFNAKAVNDNVRQAVQRTRGEVITYNGEPIVAYFHSSSGGRTATAEEGFGPRRAPTPYLKSKPDPETREFLVWERSFSTEEVRRAAARLGVNVGRVTSISIGKRGPSGRALTLLINGKAVPAPAFRLAIGSRAMRSTWLESIYIKGNRVYMKGRGYGHGVGMSQWGALALAEKGKTAEDIVNFYYSGVKVEKIWQ